MQISSVIFNYLMISFKFLIDLKKKKKKIIKIYSYTVNKSELESFKKI